MMKNIITVFLMLIVSTAHANPDVITQHKPVYCAPFADLVNGLKNSPYNETPVWMAKDGDDGSRYVLFVNGKNNNWTLVQVWSATGCILGAGTGSQNIDNKPGI